MADVDHDLIRQARRLATGANVHQINTWIFCYELSTPGSARQSRYEKLLRELVTSRAIATSARLSAELIRNYGQQVRAKSDELNRKIDSYLMQTTQP